MILDSEFCLELLHLSYNLILTILQIGKENMKPNIRKTPSKISKFFKNRDSQKVKTTKMSKHQENEDLAWFDLDSVFGFDAED